MSYRFKCIDCEREYQREDVEYVCPSCSERQERMKPTRGVLKVLFEYDKLLPSYAAPELLPLDDPSFLPPLKVGPTPLYKNTRLAEGLGLDNLYIKDDTVLPTGSFKDRASWLVVAKARELRKDTVVCASTGNAAAALAGMCASVGMNCVILVPSSAPPAKLTQIASYGANIIPVNGTYDDAFELSLLATREFGWYNRNTAYNPFTIEGKKTAALEIFEQLGGRQPDKIFIPTGDGAILAGIYKGFWDLLQLGLVRKIPELIAVQAEGSRAITALFNGSQVSGDTPRTIADSICVSAPRNANWAVKAIKETGGRCVNVSDKEIISAIRRLASLTGIFAEPAAAAAAAGLFKTAEGGHALHKDETVVLLITGTGLKDIPAASKAVKIPPPATPSIDSLKRMFK